MQASASAIECQNQTDYDDDIAQDLEAGDWFDPGGNRKPRKQRKSSSRFVQSTAMGKLQHHLAYVQPSPAISSRIPSRATASTPPTQATSGQGTKRVSTLATSKTRPQWGKAKAAYKKPPTNNSTPVSRRVTAIAELTQLLTDDIIEPNPTARTVSSGAVETSPTGATARAVAQDKVDQANLRIIALQAAAEEAIRIASETKAQFFEAHGRVLESTIAQEKIYAGEGPPADLDGTELPVLEYDYRIATSTASHAEAVISDAKNDLKTKERLLENVTSAEWTPSVVTVFPPEETPAKRRR